MHTEEIKHTCNMTSKPTCLQFYDSLENTATAFVNAIISRPSSHQPDYTRLYDVAAPHFRITFAPRTFANLSPTLHEGYDIGAFCQLVQGMTAGNHLSVQRARIREIIIDVKKSSAVVRADYFLHVDGEIGDILESTGLEVRDGDGATCLNETIFFLQFTEKGDKIVDAIQYVDPIAMGAVNEIIIRLAGGRDNIDASNLF